MCKIFAMTNMENVALTQKFVDTVKQQVCKLSDRDGFGYAVLGKGGTIGGERTVRPFSFKPLTVNAGNKVVHKLPIVLKSSNTFGKIDSVAPKAFIAHGRLSTNQVCIENTHPFTNGEVALIHNGVVSDDFELVKKSLTTTCDSEILLRHWELDGMKSVEENVSGYYAMAVLDKKGLLHIARDDKAMLYISYVRSVHSYMIATTKEIIVGVCRKMRWKYEQPEELLSNMYAVFDGNEIVSHEEIDPIGAWGYTNTMKANAALGVYDETDPEKEEAPSYRELMAKDDYYTGRHERYNSTEGSGALVPQELRSLPSNDDGPSAEETYENEVDTPLDCVDAMEESMRTGYAG